MSAIRPGLQAFSSAFNRIAMKKLLYILAGLGLAACTSDIEELPEVGPQPGREVTLTGISGTASRTQFVPGDGTEIQFQWSTGDRIWAGGVQSAEAGTDGNVADFGFTNLPGDAPYRIYYNMTGTDAEAVVPTEQRQAEPGKLQLGPNGDFGYATTDSEGRFTLSHATAYVWFNPWSQDVKEKLVSVTLAATDASTVLTGTRTFDGTGFSDATDANNAVTLSFGKEGVELPATSSTASVFAAAVVYPADCSAEEIHVTYTFADGSVYTETKTGRNFEAGRIYRLTTEIAKRDGGSLEIQGLEDSDEPVCMKYGASEAYALTAGGWIPTVEMTSAPAGWTADFDIARRSLLIAPPAEYTDGMDLENTVTIQSDDKPILSQEYYVLDFTHPEGTFVLIEGNMTSENGTIVYFDQHMRYHEKVYEEINDNEIGNVLQDMYLANGKIYFITQNGKTSSMGTTFNGDGRFVVCDAHTMKRLVARDMPFYANIDTSTGATQSSKSTLCWPQHIVVVSPEKAYIQYSTADIPFGHPYRGPSDQYHPYERHPGYIRRLHENGGDQGPHDLLARQGLRRTRQFGDRPRSRDGCRNQNRHLRKPPGERPRKGLRWENLCYLYGRIYRKLGHDRCGELHQTGYDRSVGRERRGRFGNEPARTDRTAHGHGFADSADVCELHAAAPLFHRQTGLQRL